MSKILLVGSTNEQKFKLINKFKTIKFRSYKEEEKINCDAVITFNRKDANNFLKKFNAQNNYNWLHLSGAGIDDYIKFYSKKIKKFKIITNLKNIQGQQDADHCGAARGGPAARHGRWAGQPRSRCQRSAQRAGSCSSAVQPSRAARECRCSTHGHDLCGHTPQLPNQGAASPAAG